MSRIRKKIEEIHFNRDKESVFVRVLKPISYLYDGLSRIRRNVYEKGLIKSHRAGCYTISVGNLTYGGSGKTPVVITLARLLSEKGLRVGVVHSGYGSPAHRSKRVKRLESASDGVEAGDEAAEIFVKARDALVYSSRDRLKAIERAIRDGGVNVCILDDAFQYLRVNSDLKIVVVDYNERFGNEFCLPAGPMRESLGAIRMADLIWFVSHKELKRDSTLEEELRRINSSLRFIYSVFRPLSLIRLSDMKEIGFSDLKGGVISFSGIGRDNRFVEMLSSINIKSLRHLSFGDHHRYTLKDLEEIAGAARECGAVAIITTEKDYLRDTSIMSSINNLYVLRIDLDIVEGRLEVESIGDSLV